MKIMSLGIRLNFRLCTLSGKVLHIDQRWFSQSLTVSFDQSCFLFQLNHQLGCLLVGTAQFLHNVFQCKDDIYSSFLINPLVFHRKRNPVQHQAIQNLCIGADVLKLSVPKQRFRNAEKSKLLCLFRIKVVKSHNFLLNNKKETPYHWSFIMIYGCRTHKAVCVHAGIRRRPL